MNPITAVSSEVPRDLAGEISDWLAERQVFCATWEDREGGPSRVETYIPQDPGAPEWAPYAGTLCATVQEAEDAISAACAAFGTTPSFSVAPVRMEDWAESWKRFFKTLRISPHLVVRPPWEEYTPAPGERVIVLDPGMSFGTGKHETTRSCLRLLDELAPECANGRLLDVGCGSGILSIAAAMLGYRDVLGIDNDPDAVRIAAENAAANSVAAKFSVCDLAVCRERAPVVVANVLAPVLTRFAAQVSACVERVPGNALILSGILDTQYPAVRAAYEAQGAVERRTVLAGEWRSGLFEF